MNIEELKLLLKLKKEGEYWDYKREPHAENYKLIHDIICMANALTKRNKYIIIGISDPKEGCEIIGLNKDTKNRKTQQNYIDLLSKIKFAGSIRPEINLHQLIIDNKEIDVLEIVDRKLKPYYLSENYYNIHANYIYTRIGDTNTPINQSADPNIIEKMWRERFGIDLLPINKIELLLDNIKEWIIDPGNKKYGYNEQFPEYQIEFSDFREGKETYSYYYPNDKTYFGELYLKYHQTILKEIQLCWVDGYRYLIVTPEIGNIEYNGGMIKSNR